MVFIKEKEATVSAYHLLNLVFWSILNNRAKHLCNLIRDWYHPRSCICLGRFNFIDGKSYNPFIFLWTGNLILNESFYPFSFQWTLFSEMGGIIFIFRIFSKISVFPLIFVSKEFEFFPIRMRFSSPL